MGQIVMIASGKGGVGKTTVAANLCACLALEGKKVVAIDLDLGLRSLDLCLGINNAVYDICDVASGVCSPFEAIVTHPYINGLHYIAAALTKGFDDISVQNLKSALNALAERFDYIVIDVPAGLGRGFELSARSSERALLVATPDLSSVRDAEIAAARLRSAGVTDIRLIINRVRYKLAKQGLSMDIDEMIDFSGVQLIGVIPEDERFIVHQSIGRLIVENKRLIASQQLFDIAKRLDGDIVPLKRFW